MLTANPLLNGNLPPELSRKVASPDRQIAAITGKFAGADFEYQPRLGT
jgi:hypothetical protein